MVTMRDVATQAGVSVTTVSHVLNKSRPVRPETQEAVRAAVAELGYAGDGVARSLRKGATETIGLVMSGMSNIYFADLVHAIERSVSAAGYSILLAETHEDPHRELQAVQDLLSRRVDALILAPSLQPEAAVELIRKRSLPLVLIDRIPAELKPGMDAIGVINEEPTAQLVDHLAARGHERIALIKSALELPTTLERQVGYQRGLERNGLYLRPELVRIGGFPDQSLSNNAIDELLSLAEPPTAIVSGNNRVTIETLSRLKALGLQVPHDMALAAFDDFPWSDILNPPLTAIAQPITTMGVRAVELLFSRIREPELEPRIDRLQPVFMHRESCGCGVL